MKHNTYIQGIPCTVEYDAYPAFPGSMETPYEPAYIEIGRVYDRKGYRAEWLERKMTIHDIDRIREEIEE